MDIINYAAGEKNNGISTITLTQPQSLSIQGKQELLLAIRKVAEDRESRVLIIAQGHPQAFLVDANDLINHIRQVVKMVGQYVCEKTVHTKNNKRMWFGNFLDADGNAFDTVHFPNNTPMYPFRALDVI